jgi:hypothetical protein
MFSFSLAEEWVPHHFTEKNPTSHPLYPSKKPYPLYPSKSHYTYDDASAAAVAVRESAFVGLSKRPKTKRSNQKTIFLI